jgi:hypothetical protein
MSFNLDNLEGIFEGVDGKNAGKVVKRMPISKGNDGKTVLENVFLVGSKIEKKKGKAGDYKQLVLTYELRDENGTVTNRSDLKLFSFNFQRSSKFGEDKETGLNTYTTLVSNALLYGHIASPYTTDEQKAGYKPLDAIKIGSTDPKTLQNKPENKEFLMKFLSGDFDAKLDAVISDIYLDKLFTHCANWLVEVTKGGEATKDTPLKFKFVKNKKNDFISIPRFCTMYDSLQASYNVFVAKVGSDEATKIAFSDKELQQGLTRYPDFKPDEESSQSASTKANLDAAFGSTDDKATETSTEGSESNDLPFL